jgi:hypothetical protein
MPDCKVNTNAPLPRDYQVCVSLKVRIRSDKFSPGEPVLQPRSLFYGFF